MWMTTTSPTFNWEEISYREWEEEDTAVYINVYEYENGELDAVVFRTQGDAKNDAEKCDYPIRARAVKIDLEVKSSGSSPLNALLVLPVWQDRVALCVFDSCWKHLYHAVPLIYRHLLTLLM